MLKKQWLEEVRGQGGTRGKSGTQRSFASGRLFAASQTTVSTTSSRYFASFSLKTTKGKSLKGAGKLHVHYFFECVIATIDDRQYCSCGNRVELGLPPSATQVGCRRPGQTDRSMHAVSSLSLGRVIPNRPIQASFQTSVPKTLAESPSELMARFIHG